MNSEPGNLPGMGLTTAISEFDDTPGLHVIRGRPGSGKTQRLFAPLRAALAQGDDSVRVIVPSSTLREHLTHELARDGFVLRRHTVATFTGLLEEFPGPGRRLSRSQLHATLEALLARQCPAEYEPVRESRVFRGLLLDCLDSLALAGAKPRDVPGAIGRVYAQFCDALHQDHGELRGQQLQRLAEELGAESAESLPAGRIFLFDGFYNFSATERQFLAALARHRRVALTIPSPDGDASRREAEVRLTVRRDREQEVLSIAAEIQRLHAQGERLRSIGVVLVNPRGYAALLESVFRRLGIPSRSYLGRELTRHPLWGFLRDWLAAAESDWDALRALEMWRWNLVGHGTSAAGDTLELRTRREAPAAAADLEATLAGFGGWARQLGDVLTVKRRWLEVFRFLAAPRAFTPSEESAFRWLDLSGAMKQVEKAFEAAAESFPPGAQINPGQLWVRANWEMEKQVLWERDDRQEVVHIMDVYESRQWELKHVFAPGLLEGDFPKPPAPDPFLSDDVRASLGMKTLAEREQEQELLWEVLRSRATASLHLSYPARDWQGEALTPSPFLGSGVAAASDVNWAVARAAPARETAPLGSVAADYRPRKNWGVTEFESYLACPFQHFARHGLQLQTLPELPGERLNTRLLGTVAHEALRRWLGDPGRPLAEIAGKVFDDAIRRERIPPGYRVELERLTLVRNLSLCEKEIPPVAPGWVAHAEEEFEFALAAGVRVRGRIDRYDVGPGGIAQVFDYKYTKADGLREKYVQGGLYVKALAAMDPPVEAQSFHYVALREEAKLSSIAGEQLEAVLRQVDADVQSVVSAVSAGRVPVRPADPKACVYCDFQDLCRIRSLAVEEEEEAREAAE